MVFGSGQVVVNVGAVMHETRVCGCLVRTIKDRTLGCRFQVPFVLPHAGLGPVQSSKGKGLLS